MNEVSGTTGGAPAGRTAPATGGRTSHRPEGAADPGQPTLR